MDETTTLPWELETACNTTLTVAIDADRAGDANLAARMRELAASLRARAERVREFCAGMPINATPEHRLGIIYARDTLCGPLPATPAAVPQKKEPSE